jgi:uncharacterized protein (TIGR02118 family)
MVCLTVIYPTGSDSHFDRKYYLEKHVPFVGGLCEPFGFKRVEVSEGRPGIDGSKAAYHFMANLYFDSADGLQKSFARHGAEIVADIPRYTNVQPTIYVGEVQGSDGSVSV